MTRLGHYYYHLPQEPRGGVIGEEQYNQRSNVLYDSDGVVYHWGDGDNTKLTKFNPRKERNIN
eukprot:Pgem_evm1s4374